ncbi:MAG: M3 family metallopeptidase [Saprospiraceae bacterium]
MLKNPFLTPFETSHGVPPFDKIKEYHFAPAIKAGIKAQKKEIKDIIDLSETSNFDNTILALENSGAIIRRATSVLYNLSYANTTSVIQDILQKLAPTLSAHSDSIFMNKALFAKVKYLMEHRKELRISGQKYRLLDVYYKSFIRSGANLKAKDKKRVSEINQKLSLLSLRFGKNILDTVNGYQLIIGDKNRLSGLPDQVIASAAQAATDADIPDKWMFTLQNASVIPFLQYADDRSLRKEIWQAFVNKGNMGDDFDNNAIVAEMVQLRSTRAQILGYDTHADFVLEEQMAKTPANVLELLHKLWPAALRTAELEAENLQKLIIDAGEKFDLQAWDWRYYAEKLRKKQYDIDEESIKPYFSLDGVIKGVFDVTEKLYGLRFIERMDLPVYHQEVKSYEVVHSDDKVIGVLYMDFFPRNSKQGGAWMTSYVAQHKEKSKRILPVISVVCNFTKPIADAPSLLTSDEVNTLFHEFGHALHGLLSDVRYASLAGTSVATDFVELPSQIMENWCMEPEVLQSYARHYKTGDAMPDDLIEKLLQSEKYGQGFATVEYLAASILDMSYHTISSDSEMDIGKFEQKIMHDLHMPDAIVPRYRSTYFSHIFAGGYSSGYYSYIWSEVLDSDAFSVFSEKGLFDKYTADTFKKHILSKGNTADPMKLYIKFRGRKPTIEPLIQKRGLVDA